MIINFYKYQGTGNDFIIIDSRKINLDLTENNIKNIANRKFGIGSDGVIIIRNHPDYHFEMQFYNPDGSQSFCGNGSRCAVLFSFHMGICPRECTFLSTDGIHSGEVIDDLNVKINIVGPVKLTKLSSGDFELNTGSPHYIKFVDDLKMEDFIVKSRIIRNNANYINSGINVNFVSSDFIFCSWARCCNHYLSLTFHKSIHLIIFSSKSLFSLQLGLKVSSVALSISLSNTYSKCLFPFSSS